MPVKILVTGFEPFGPDAVNAAWEAVSRLPEAIGGAEIVKRRLPVEYEAGPARLEALVEERGIPGGFLHVPCCCEQTLEKPGCPSLPLPAITAGLEAAVGAIAESLRKG